MEQIQLKSYLEKLRQKPKSKARTHLQEIATPYLRYIIWTDTTFEKDMSLFWIKINQFYKRKGEYETKKILDWVKDKNSLHPKQVIKALL